MVKLIHNSVDVENMQLPQKCEVLLALLDHCFHISVKFSIIINDHSKLFILFHLFSSFTLDVALQSRVRGLSETDHHVLGILSVILSI